MSLGFCKIKNKLMLSQKIQIIPFVNNIDKNSPASLVFWKKVVNGSNQEINCFLQIEARTPGETEELGKELFEIVNEYLKDSISKNIFPFNPENLCEEILKIFNQTLFVWGQKVKLQSWSDLNIFVGAVSAHGFYFSKIGDSRVALFRNQEIVLVDEKLGGSRSPHFSSPFGEVTGGNLQGGDKFLVLSKKLVPFLSFEEVASLISFKDPLSTFFNIVRSVEVIQAPVNTSFILGEIDMKQEPVEPLPQEIFAGKITEYAIGENLFTEFNSLIQAYTPVESEISISKSQPLPWGKIALTGKNMITKLLKPILGLLSFPFKYLLQRTSDLSFFRRTILFSGLAFFVIFLVSVGYFFFNKPETKQNESVDYQAMLDKANKLIEDSDSSLLYKDEDKARKDLGEADTLLEKVSESGDLGIKALKIRKDVQDRIAVLDKTKGASNISLIWNIPDQKGTVKNIAIINDNLAVIADSSVWTGKLDQDKTELKEVSTKDPLLQGKSCLLPEKSLFLLIYPEAKVYFELLSANQNLSAKKDIAGGNDKKLSICSSYGNFLYFWSSEEQQIQQYTYDSSGIKFNRNWLTTSLKDDLQNDDIVSLTVDGSIYALTGKGNLIKLSGGKKAPFDFEKPATPPSGNKDLVKTNDSQKYLYLLDPEKGRVIIFDKTDGKSKGQIQDKILSEAVDMDIRETKNEIYFVSGKSLFKMTFSIE